jgi:hypothetical protein
LPNRGATLACGETNGQPAMRGRKEVGRRRAPKGMGWDAASNPFRVASLGGNTTLPIGLFRQHRSSCRRSGAPQNRLGAMRRWADTVSNRGDDLCPTRTVATPWGRNKTRLRRNCDFAPAAGWARPRIPVDSERDADLLWKATPCYLNRVIYDLPTPADRHSLRRFAFHTPLLGPGSGFHRAPMPGKGRRDSIGDDTCLPHSTASRPARP